MKNQMMITTKRDIKAEKENKAKDLALDILDDVIFWSCYALMFISSMRVIARIDSKTKWIATMANGDIMSFVIFTAMLMISYVVTKVVLLKLHRTIIKHVKL